MFSGASRAQRMRANSSAIVELFDGWALLEEMPAKAVSGNGKRLGFVIRQVLANAGYSEAELIGVSATFGRILPRAGLGQSENLLPGDGQSAADWLRQLLDRFGHGASLVIDELGVWRLSVRSTALRSVTLYESGFVVPGDPDSGTFESEKTVALEFSSLASRNNSRTYPGRLAVLGPLDYSHDFAEFFNDFTVEGGIDPLTGQRLVARHTLHESVSNPDAANYLGRLKSLPIVRDESLRTMADVLLVLRSLVARYGRPGRFASFETYFHPFFFPDDRVLIDGTPFLLKRINGGSLARDRMSIAAQELAA